MKHKLKLLLTISTLILPSAFAATHHEHTSADGVNTSVVTVAADNTQALTHKSSFLDLFDVKYLLIGSVGATSPSGDNTSIDDIIQSMSEGEYFNGPISLGFLTVADLVALSGVSRRFRDEIQGKLIFLRRFVVAQTAPTAPALTVSEMALIHGFLKGKDPTLGHRESVNAAAYMNAAVRFLSLNMPDAADVMLEMSASRPTLTADEIQSAARELAHFGPKYKEWVTRMFERIANRPTATADNIRCVAAWRSANPGPYYTDRAVLMFEMSAKCPPPSDHSIIDAARELAIF